jgi:hypothetical protein
MVLKTPARLEITAQRGGEENSKSAVYNSVGDDDGHILDQPE